MTAQDEYMGTAQMRRAVLRELRDRGPADVRDLTDRIHGAVRGKMDGRTREGRAWREACCAVGDAVYDLEDVDGEIVLVPMLGVWMTLQDAGNLAAQIQDALPAGDDDTACDDCGTETLSLEPGVPTEFYMVHDQVWRAARAKKRAILCVGCLEARLGRTLDRGDFPDVPLNDISDYRPDRAYWYRSGRLASRLRAGQEAPA